MIKTIDDILDRMLRYHNDLETYYLYQSRIIHDTRMVALLDFLARSERYLGSSISEYQQLMPLNSLYREVGRDISSIKFPEPEYYHGDFNAKIDAFFDIMRIALHNESVIANYCKSISANITAPAVCSEFKKICKRTVRERRGLISYRSLFSA